MQRGMRYRLAFLFAAGGFALCGYAGLQWHALRQYSEEDLKASTELNLQIDLARQGLQGQPPPEQLEPMRQKERAEIEAEIASQRETVLRWLAAGLASLALAGGQWLAGRLAGPNDPDRPV